MSRPKQTVFHITEEEYEEYKQSRPQEEKDREQIIDDLSAIATAIQELNEKLDTLIRVVSKSESTSNERNR